MEEYGFCAAKSSAGRTDARATGTLQQQSKTNTVPAINLLNIGVTELRLTRAGWAICDRRHIGVCVGS